MAGEGMSRADAGEGRTAADEEQAAHRGPRLVPGRSSEEQAAADTVGEVLALFDCGAEDAAWLAVHAVAGLLASGRSNAHELTQEATVRAFDQRAAALRRMDPSVTIRAWLMGVFAKLGCEQRRKPRARGGAPLAAIADGDGRKGAATSPAETVDPEFTGLTPRQKKVLELRIQGITDCEGARSLEITRSAYRGRVARAIHNLRKADVKPGSRRTWAKLLLAQRLVPPNRMEPGEARKLLLLYVRACSEKAIAKKICTTLASVKNRLKRWKSWWLNRRETEKTAPK